MEDGRVLKYMDLSTVYTRFYSYHLANVSVLMMMSVLNSSGIDICAVTLPIY